MGRTGLGTLALVCCAAAGPAVGTTIGGAMGNASADARPIVWKNRDGGQPTGSKRHYLSYVVDRSHRYLGVHPSDADPRMGVNELGLAFGNCTASAFTSSPNYDYANTQAFKQYVLGETSSLTQVRQAIQDNILGTADDWPDSIALMPGILDATGKAVLWELGDAEVYEYDLENPARLAQNPWQIYARDNTVHTHTDHTDDWSHSRDRYRIPRDELTRTAAAGGNGVEDVLRIARIGDPGFDDADTPSRPQTSTAMIAHGVLPGEDPRVVTMWNTLGQPDYAALVPVWVAIGDQLSPRAAGNDLDTSLSGASEKLFLMKDGTDFDEAVNAELEPMEANFFHAVAAARTRWLRDGFVADEARRIHQEASETAWHTMEALAAGTPQSLNATPRLSDLQASVTGLDVDFTAVASDPDGSLVAIEWDFGDGVTASGASPVHSYAAEGTYLVRCRVTDDAGARNSRWLYLTLGPGSAVPVVTLSVGDASAGEPGGDTGSFVLTRTGPTGAALSVNLGLTGTASEGADYQTIGPTVSIPAGSASLEVVVTPLDDVLEETDETVVATLVSGSGYVVAAPANALVSLADDDLVSLIRTGDVWHYYEGTVFPGSGWNELGFDDSGWLQGPTGIGYGDGDDATELPGMQNGYLTLYLRRGFNLPGAGSGATLRFTVDYDDGFVAFVNGEEVARRGVPTGQDHTTTAANHEAGQPEVIELQPSAGTLVAGANLLAIELHNQALDSSDASMIPQLHRVPEPGSRALLAGGLPLLHWLAGRRRRAPRSPRRGSRPGRRRSRRFA
jgi:hypothetical protein